MSGLVVMTIVNVINATVSAALMLGIGPLPALGWEGLLIGTLTGHVCGGLLILALLVGGRAGYALRVASMWPDLPLIRRILRIGIPGGIDAVGLVFCHLLFVRIINELGTVASAAHGVAIQIEAIAYMPGSAFQIAAATLVGQYLGGSEVGKAKRSAWLACLAAAGVMLAAGVVFFVAAQPLVSIFLPPDRHATEVALLAARLLRLIAVAMLPLAISMVLAGALRGAGDTRWPLVITILGFVAIRLPLASYWSQDQLEFLGVSLSGMALGVVGAWYAMIVDVVLRSLMLIARFVHGGWQHVDV